MKGWEGGCEGRDGESNVKCGAIGPVVCMLGTGEELISSNDTGLLTFVFGFLFVPYQQHLLVPSD